MPQRFFKVSTSYEQMNTSRQFLAIYIETTMGSKHKLILLDLITHLTNQQILTSLHLDPIT